MVHINYNMDNKSNRQVTLSNYAQDINLFGTNSLIDFVFKKN